MLQKKPNESVKESAPNKPGMIKPSLINQNQQGKLIKFIIKKDLF